MIERDSKTMLLIKLLRKEVCCKVNTKSRTNI
jgi:hypothetical protein